MLFRSDSTINKLIKKGKNQTVIDYAVNVIKGNKIKANEVLAKSREWKEVAPWATPTADNDLLLVKAIVDKL